MDERILIIGGTGLLGHYLVNQAKDMFKVYSTYLTHKPKNEEINYYKLDKRCPSTVKKVFTQIKPNIVIDASVYGTVEYCETHPVETREVNVYGTINIIKECYLNNCRLVFISTDWVFDGNASRLYTELDAVKPINEYGKQKAAIENMLSFALENYAIVRTAVIYGWSHTVRRTNYTEYVIDQLKNRKEVKALINEYETPTYAKSLAIAILALSKTTYCGIFHVVGKSCVNRCELALAIAEVFGLNKDLIKPATLSEFNFVAKRPRYTCLDTAKVQSLINFKPLDIHTGLTLMRDETNGHN